MSSNVKLDDVSQWVAVFYCVCWCDSFSQLHTPL